MKRAYLVLGSVALAALGMAYLVTLSSETAEASITLKPNKTVVVSLGKRFTPKTVPRAMALR